MDWRCDVDDGDESGCMKLGRSHWSACSLLCHCRIGLLWIFAGLSKFQVGPMISMGCKAVQGVLVAVEIVREPIFLIFFSLRGKACVRCACFYFFTKCLNQINVAA